MPGAKYFYLKSQLRQVLRDKACQVCFRIAQRVFAELSKVEVATQQVLIYQDSAGSIIGRSYSKATVSLMYAPYGCSARETALEALLQYNGERLDSLVNGYFLGNGERLYSVVRPGFLSYDSPGSPFGNGGLNGYAYCGGDPINHNDPSGKTRMRTGTAKPLKRTWAETRRKLNQSSPEALVNLIEESPKYLPHIKGAEAANALNHVLALSYDPLAPIPKGLFASTREMFMGVRERRLKVNARISAFLQSPSPAEAKWIHRQLLGIRNLIKFERDRAHVRLHSVTRELLSPALEDIKSWRQQ
ncbi:MULTISPECIES: RHS repeat-associated core domain-containing protein [Pseudomonas]|nr:MULTISPECIES: RHS repeat-associated core domain-containing protein [Pseudomonas]MCE0852300.1 RHS repeat-associated core domain-containing protein [Pseudomonas asiatica]MCO6688992.1 RHS repeat-associated core domain-containing protein [Pseudomonas shirazica]